MNLNTELEDESMDQKSILIRAQQSQLLGLTPEGYQKSSVWKAIKTAYASRHEKKCCVCGISKDENSLRGMRRCDQSGIGTGKYRSDLHHISYRNMGSEKV